MRQHRTWCHQHEDEEEACYSPPVEFGRPRTAYGGKRPALYLVDEGGITGIRADVPNELTLGELTELAAAIEEIRKLAA